MSEGGLSRYVRRDGIAMKVTVPLARPVLGSHI